MKLTIAILAVIGFLAFNWAVWQLLTIFKIGVHP
jgi:hypothetical protein